MAGENVSYTWDSAAGCTYGIGRLCQVSDAAGQTTFAYDAQGNLTQQTRLEAGVTSITRYGYDAANRPAAVIPPTGETVSLSRNSVGRIAQVVASNGAASTVLAQQLKYNGAGQVTAQTLGNGVTQTSSFDLSGQVSAQTASSGTSAATDGDVPTLPEWGALLLGGLLLFSSLLRRPRRRAGMPLLALFGLSLLLGGALGTPAAWADASVQYDAAGNVIQRSTALGATTYTYDALDRLNSEVGPAKTQSFSYDANGNRLTDGMGSYTYPATSNKMSTRLGTAVTHDAAGHLTSDGSGKTYVYNQAGQLSQVKQGATLLATYYYNYRGERSRKVTSAAAPQGAQTVLYHYDQQSHLIAETSGTGAPLRTYVWRDEAPLAQIEYVPSRRVLYYELDQTNTPRAATDATGKVVWRWESDAFGSSAANEDPDGDGVKTTVNLRFPGQYYDQESGLHQNYFRDYDPRVGRYVEADPIGLRGGLNPYAYVNGNPLRFVDPTGLVKWSGNVLSTGAFAGGAEIYTLRSECVNGLRSVVKVRAIGYSYGRGYTFAGSAVSFSDRFSYINPEVFNGPYQKVSAGLGWGIGYGFSEVTLGGAQSPGSWGWEAGIDASVGMLVGKSSVSSETTESCGCSQK